MPHSSSLTARFENDYDGTGKLVIAAEANGFSGKGGAYFSIEELQKFATSIQQFPLPKISPLIAGGFWSQSRPSELEQELVAIAVTQIDNRGHIGVQVRLASELWPSIRPESQHKVQLEVLTTHEPLRRFGEELQAVLSKARNEASLEGEF